MGSASWAVSVRTWGQSKLLRTRLGQKPFPGMRPLPQIVKSPPRAACQGRIDHCPNKGSQTSHLGNSHNCRAHLGSEPKAQESTSLPQVKVLFLQMARRLQLEKLWGQRIGSNVPSLKSVSAPLSPPHFRCLVPLYVPLVMPSPLGGSILSVLAVWFSSKAGRLGLGVPNTPLPVHGG